MPFGIRGSKHSNRSQQALNTTTVTGSQNSSQDDLQSISPPQPNALIGQHSNSSSIETQAFLDNRVQSQDFDPQVYPHHPNSVSRSQLQQYPQGIPSQPPPQYAATHEKGPEDERPSIRKAAQTVLAEQKKGRSRGFFGIGSHKPKSADQSTVSSPQPSLGAHNNTSGGLGRRISKKNKGQPSVRTSLQKDSSDQQYLPSPHEEDTEDLDPYQIQDSEQHSSPINQVNTPSVRLLPRDQIPPVDTNVSGQNLQTPQYHSNTPSSQISNPSSFSQQTRYNTGKYADQHQANSPNTLFIPQLIQPINSDNISQVSQDTGVESDFRSSPIKHTGPPFEPGNNNNPSHLGDLLPRVSSLEASQPSSPIMPAGGNRQPVEGKPTYQTDGREVPPNYKQKFSGHGQSLQKPGAQGSYRGAPSQRESFQTSGEERGRETPPPSEIREDGYKELLQKYKKVKGLYFEKTAQVEQLQNTIANQRLSHSRTALDDNEYSTRFNRLDGAINNLAFNIRKDWVTIPAWLCPVVNQEAQKVGTKEMTAVGRAYISRWLTEEVFHRTFHPGLEPELSASLKMIESNIRKHSPPANSQEESESLTTKIVHWRLATLDGLSYVLNSSDSTEFKDQFTQMAVTNLTANLMSHLQDPPPPGLEGSATMIVELAVGIAANLPLESRDISIIYPMPGDPIRLAYMKIEPALPALENPGIEAEAESSSTSSGSKDNLTEAQPAESSASKAGGGGKGKEKTRNSMLAGLIGSSKKSQSTASIEPAVASQNTATANKEAGRESVRFAGFVGVEVIGRSMLVKAPVWTVT